MRKTLLTAVTVTSLVALSACGESPASKDTASADPEPATPAAAPAAEVASASFADLTGDATAGKTVFVKCKTCHTIEEGKNAVGPSLYNVVGRTAGSIEGFNYSDANKSSGITWTPEILFEYLEDPRGYLPGTRMAFPGIKDAQERADLIAYLETNGQ